MRAAVIQGRREMAATMMRMTRVGTRRREKVRLMGIFAHQEI